jgi:hypothetical protein
MVELNAASPLEQPPEQLRYAMWLNAGSRLGLVVLVLTFIAYVLGGLPPRVPAHELSALWHLPAAEFTRLTGMPNGWAWLGHLQHGDMAGLIGIALLASCSLPSLLALLPLYQRAGDRAYVAICVAEVAVLLLAASGVFTVGH